MTNDELNAALYERMVAEQERYKAWLLKQSPGEILDHCYEYTIREDIVMAMEEHVLSDRQCNALLKSPVPLGGCFQGFPEARRRTHG